MSKAQHFSSDNLMYQKPNYALRYISNALFAIMVVISLFFIGFSFMYISTPVVGESMQPTLNPKGSDKSDIVYVNKFANYEKGDIVVIKQLDSENEYIIKRVIGTNGDLILITLNETTNQVELYVKNILQNELYIFDIETSNYPDNHGMFTTLNNFNTLRTTKPHLFNEQGELVVPQNEIFALGDNRGNSLDSSTKGTFHISLIVGKVDYIVPYGQNEWNFFLNIFTPFTFNFA